MTAMTDFDRLVASWLENDGPNEIRLYVVDAAMETARSTRRRSALETALAGPRPWPTVALGRIGPAAWRLAIAIAVAAILIALLLATAFVGESRRRMPFSEGNLAIADDAGLSIADGVRFPIAASDRRQVLADGPAFEPRWSPDGAYIGVLIGDGRLRDLVIVRPDGTIVGRTSQVKEYRWLGQLLLVPRDDNLIDVLRPDLLLVNGERPIDLVQGRDPANQSFDAPLADVLAVRRDHSSGAINGWGGSPQDLGLITFVTFRPGHGSSTGSVRTNGTDVRG